MKIQKERKIPIAVTILICSVLLVFTLNFIFATPITTPGLNYAGGRDGGSNFTNPLNAVGSDEVVCASASNTAITQQYDNFGFTIHPSGVIYGIKVTILGSTSSGSETWSVYLRKNNTGSISPVTATASVTNNNACGATQQTLTFGNLTGTFGQSWSASELDSSGFTVGVSLPTVGAGITRRVNWIKVEVNYSLPTTTTTVTSTTTLTSTSTTTLTSTFNTTKTYNTTTTLTSTSTTTLTSTFNTTTTFTNTINTTITNTFNTTITTTITLTNTTTVTAAICRTGLCAGVILPNNQISNTFYYGIFGGLIFIFILIAVVARRRNQ